MDRLTHERVNGIKTGYWSMAKKEELIARLAAYENTGLTPEEIKSCTLQWRGPEAGPPKIAEPVMIARVKDPAEPLKVEQAVRMPGGWWKVFGTNVKRIELWAPMPQVPEALLRQKPAPETPEQREPVPFC